MELLLPETLNIDSLSSVVSAWPPVEEDAVLNFSAQRWVYPSGTVGLSCLIEGAISRGQTVQGLAGECRNITYWERMGFFDNFHVPGIPSSGARREAGDRFSEIRLIYEIDEVESELKVTEKARGRRPRRHG